MTTNAKKIIEKLREGVPPRHGVERYSVGNEKLLAGVGSMLDEDIDKMGIIRFIDFFRRLLRVIIKTTGT